MLPTLSKLRSLATAAEDLHAASLTDLMAFRAQVTPQVMLSLLDSLEAACHELDAAYKALGDADANNSVYSRWRERHQIAVIRAREYNRDKSNSDQG